MGCDIHLFIEKRVGKDSPWTADENHTIDICNCVNSCPTVGRNYELFGILAGVRTCSIGLYPRRGLPDDVSERVKLASDSWGEDGHSHSYLTLSEFTECVEKAGYKLGTNKSIDAFYNWRSTPRRHWPEDYSTIINYCNRWIDDHNVDNLLLNTQHEPEVRIVFWFDN